ncbi:MAG TPA: GntR family transcriptional regulator [Puia sp.]|nr:GntR family transcriptional regulator [Puia sp.]
MEFKDNEAIYLQIAGLVCENILTGKWTAGQKILSVRDLAVELEVNPNTVMRSYDLLQELKIVHNRRGQGLFVAEDGLERAVAWRKQNFLQQYLPEFFKNIYLLGISIDEMRKQYEAFVSGRLAGQQQNQDHANKH